MTSTAIERMAAQGEYLFEVNAYTAKVAAGCGVKDEAIRVEFGLKVTPLAEASWMSKLAVSVRLVGPARSFDRTEFDEVIVGIAKFTEDECELGIVCAPEFLTYSGEVLRSFDSRIVLRIVTATKIVPGHRQTELILGAELRKV